MGHELLWTAPGERLVGQEGANHVPGCSALPKLCLPQVLFQSLPTPVSKMVRTQVRAQRGQPLPASWVGLTRGG